MKKTKLTETEDRITYSESVKVNIGDYESRDIFCSYNTVVKNGESIEEAFERGAKHVQKVLSKKERHVRMVSEGDCDFETMERLNYYTKKKTKK